MTDLLTMANKLRSLRDFNSRCAEEAAPLLEAAVKATAAAGTTPDGKAWAPKKKDGGRALVNAAAHVSAEANGETCTVTLEGVEVIHNYGAGKLPRRQILPEAGSSTPKIVTDACQEATRRAFEKAMR